VLIVLACSSDAVQRLKRPPSDAGEDPEPHELLVDSAHHLSVQSPRDIAATEYAFLDSRGKLTGNLFRTEAACRGDTDHVFPSQ
jgi:hypothetical protein